MAASDHHSPDQFRAYQKVAQSLISDNVWDTEGVRRKYGLHSAPPTTSDMEKLTDEYPTVGKKIGRLKEKVDSTLESNYTNRGILWPYMD